MSFIPSILALVKVGQDVVESLEKEEMEYDPAIAKSLKNCRSLIQVISKSDKKKERFTKKFEPFFKDNFQSLCKPYYVEDEGEMLPDTTFYGAGDTSHVAGKFRGICLIPHEKDPSICIPFSEIFELAIDLDESNHKEYGMFVPRLVYILLSAMSCLESDGFETDDIDMIMVSLESDAQIDHGLGSMMDSLPGLNIDPNAAQNLMSEFAGSEKLNEIVGAVGSIMDKVKGGGLADIIGAFTGKSSAPELDIDPDDQD